MPDYTAAFKALFNEDWPDATPMYSYTTPAARFWDGVANCLHDAGKSDDEIRSILRSKDARWMMDAYEIRLTELGREIAARYFGFPPSEDA